MNPPEITVLDNGLRVASWAMPGLETAAIAVIADAGSRHERPELNGLAHLFEHMVFKGTHRRSARAIAEEMEDVGGQLLAVRVDAPRQPERESSKGCRGGAKCGGDGGE